MEQVLVTLAQEGWTHSSCVRVFSFDGFAIPHRYEKHVTASVCYRHTTIVYR